jgi:hypothetical protein
MGSIVRLSARRCHKVQPDCLAPTSTTLRPHDPEYQQKVEKLKRLLNTLPHNEIAVFQDEAEVCTNPKIGSMWMPRGQQTTVETPGTNEKCHLNRLLGVGHLSTAHHLSRTPKKRVLPGSPRSPA